jgi:hypothetical protein
MNLTLILRTAPLLLETGKYEETSFAILLAHAYRDRFDRKAFNAMEKWFDVGIINWAHCDVLCALLMKEFFARGIITLDDLSEWRTAANKHQRRAVPVAMLNLLKAAKDYRPLFKIHRSADARRPGKGPAGPGLVPAGGLEAQTRTDGSLSAEMERPGRPQDLPIRHRKNDAGKQTAVQETKILTTDVTEDHGKTFLYIYSV